MVTQNRLQRSGRAVFSHPALASSENALLPNRKGRTEKGWGRPVVNKPPHSLPQDVILMTAPRECVVAEPTHLEPRHGQCWAVHRHSVVPDASAGYLAQPRAPGNVWTLPFRRLRMTRG